MTPHCRQLVNRKPCGDAGSSESWMHGSLKQNPQDLDGAHHLATAVLTFRGVGFCLFFTTDLPCVKTCPSKIISDSQTCHLIFLHPRQSCISWNLAENFSPWSLGEPTQCWSLCHSFLTYTCSSSLPAAHQHNHAHPPGLLHLLINGFKVLWCHIRGYISQLPL